MRGLKMVVNSLLQAGETVKPFLAMELLGQLKGIGQKSCSLPVSTFELIP